MGHSKHKKNRFGLKKIGKGVKKEFSKKKLARDIKVAGKVGKTIGKVGVIGGDVLSTAGKLTGQPELVVAGQTLKETSKVVKDLGGQANDLSKLVKAGKTSDALKVIGEMAKSTGLANDKVVDKVVESVDKSQKAVTQAKKGNIEEAVKLSSQAVISGVQGGKIAKKEGLKAVKPDTSQDKEDMKEPETKPVMDDLEKKTVPQLKAMLKERGLKVSGKKATLIARLRGGEEFPMPSKTSTKGSKTSKSVKQDLLRALNEAEDIARGV